LKIYYLSISLLLLTSLAVCQNIDNVWVSNSNKQVAINIMIKDFGIVNQDDKIAFKFELTNLDSLPLVIWHVTTSCGCTSPTWKEKSVKKGDFATVKVKYDSSETGVFNKSILVYTNFDDKPIKLFIKGTVVKPKSEKGISKRTSSFNSKIPQTK
jgi:hypothetical protein